jgi:N-acetylneuraminic acid mutarotase
VNDERWEEVARPRMRAALAVGLAVGGLVVVATVARLGGAAPPPLPTPAPLAVEASPTVAPALRDETTTTPWRRLPPAPLAGREGHTATWTGQELLVWGGYGSGAVVGNATALADGAAYDPGSDTWRPLPDAPIGGRFDHTAVWTGGELLVWGGSDDSVHAPASGAAYDPASDTWRQLPDAPIKGRTGHSAVWTGRELLLWGGEFRFEYADGAAYDPESDTWRVLAGAPLAARSHHAAAWTGTEMVVWGGYATTDGYALAPLGAAYNPVTDAWRAVPDGPLDGRSDHSATWTGREVVVWGGVGSGDDGTSAFFSDGAIYDPATDVWRAVPRAPLQGRFGHTAVATVGRVVIWGGLTPSWVADGAVYGVREDRWESMAGAAPLSSASRYPGTWTGREFLVWGGAPDGAGAAYPVAPPVRLPQPRRPQSLP